jgi:hypothetical protein
MHNESLLSAIGESKIERIVDNNPLMKNLFPLKDGKKIFVAPQINFFSLSIPGIGLGQPPMRLNQQVINNTQYMNQQANSGTAMYNPNMGYQSAPVQQNPYGNQGGYGAMTQNPQMQMQGQPENLQGQYSGNYGVGQPGSNMGAQGYNQQQGAPQNFNQAQGQPGYMNQQPGYQVNPGVQNMNQPGQPAGQRF